MLDRFCFMCGTQMSIIWQGAERDVGIMWPYVEEFICPGCGWEPDTKEIERYQELCDQDAAGDRQDAADNRLQSIKDGGLDSIW